MTFVQALVTHLKKPKHSPWLWFGLLCLLALLLAYRFVAITFLGVTPSLIDASGVSFTLSPDGKSLVFVGQTKGQIDLYSLDLKTRHVVQLTHDSGVEKDPAFSPDGKYIAYSYLNKVGANAHICLCTDTGKVVKQVTEGTGITDVAPAFSHDGSRIVFARATWNRPYSMGGKTWDDWDVYVVNTNGSNLQKLTNQGYYQLYPPKFSPDNRNILYAASPHSTKNLETDIFLCSSTRQYSPLSLTKSHNNSWPSYSKEGTKIVFISDQEVQYKQDLLSIETSGKHITPFHVTAVSIYNEQPQYTPDGEHIIFLGDPKPEEAMKFNLYQVDKNGAHLREIADDTLFSNPLQWRPTSYSF